MHHHAWLKTLIQIPSDIIERSLFSKAGGQIYGEDRILASRSVRIPGPDLVLSQQVSENYLEWGARKLSVVGEWVVVEKQVPRTSQGTALVQQTLWARTSFYIWCGLGNSTPLYGMKAS